MNVLDPSCGIMRGVSFASVCGGETADILIHEIHSSNLQIAIDLEFQNVSELIDEALGTNYAVIECSE